jgi:hypothetical protein
MPVLMGGWIFNWVFYSRKRKKKEEEKKFTTKARRTQRNTKKKGNFKTDFFTDVSFFFSFFVLLRVLRAFVVTLFFFLSHALFNHNKPMYSQELSGFKRQNGCCKCEVRNSMSQTPALKI